MTVATMTIAAAAETILREATQPNPHMPYGSVPNDAMEQLRAALHATQHAPAQLVLGEGVAPTREP